MKPIEAIRRHPVISTGFFLLTALIVGIISIFVFIPEHTVNNFISKKISGNVGREFTISGPLKIDWDWTTPRIHAEQIRLANLPGREDPYMAEIGSLDVSIKIWNLLRGRTVIPELTIDKPRLVLEKIDDKTKNWELPVFSKGAAVADAALPDDRHDFPAIDKMAIKDGQIIYRDENAGLNLDLKLASVSGASGDQKDSINIDGTGTLQDKEFSLTAEGGSIRTLRDTNKDFPLMLDLKMGPTRIFVKGTFKDPVKLQAMDAALEISGDNMADLFYLTAIPLPPTPAYKLTGQLGKKGDVWSYNGFKGLVGSSDLGGDISYDTGGDRGYLKGALISQNMDVVDLGGFIGLAPEKPVTNEQAQQAAQQEASPKLLPDVPLNLERLRATDMDVTLKVVKLEAPSLPFKGMNVHFDLKDGVLKLDPMDLSLADGSVVGSLALDGRNEIPAAKLNVDFKQLKLNRFFDGTRFEDNTHANIGAHVELAGTGKSFADVLGTSNGRVVTIVSGGTISLLLVEASDLDIAEATPLFLGEDTTTRIRCGVGDFKVQNGFLNSELFVLDTDDTTVEGIVKINLKQELIEAQLKADPKDASLLSLQSPITINGPLKSPSIGLEPIETGARAGVAAVLGAILTPLAAVIPFIELGEGEDKNCGALVARAKADAKKGS